MEIILASQSPRRQELLKQMGLDFSIVPSTFDEQLDDTRSPREVAQELALGKALDVAAQYPDAYVIGADTIVAIDGKQLAKPADAKEAHDMLRSLSGKAHEVTTGVAVINKNKGIEMVRPDWSVVHFKPYDAEAVARYVSTGDSYDKAGAYGIQSGAAPLISHIEGQYDTIVGMPTRLLADMLKEIGITAYPAPALPTVRQLFGGG